ncbi:MAG: hypothetical protein M3Q52_01560 [Pseudomonadota bacterium]|nr:hypothetical protein [Pseudomonadota bacterium]
MDETLWSLVNIVGPLILLGLLIWLALRWGRSRHGTREDNISEAGTRSVYAEEEQRRRDGTDGVEDHHKDKGSERL